jgi:hypothetical protein
MKYITIEILQALFKGQIDKEEVLNRYVVPYANNISIKDTDTILDAIEYALHAFNMFFGELAHLQDSEVHDFLVLQSNTLNEIISQLND